LFDIQKSVGKRKAIEEINVPDLFQKYSNDENINNLLKHTKDEVNEKVSF